jgi:energy-coupling factor transport system permease protein
MTANPEPSSGSSSNQDPRPGWEPGRPAGSRGSTAWGGLDPLTRLVASVGTLVAAILIDATVCLLLLALLAVVLPAALAGALRRVLWTATLLAAPLAVSVVIVNVLFAVDGTERGIALAVSVVARVLTMAGAVVLFYQSTRPSELVASLQWHGLSARVTFVIHNAVAMIPRLAERAREVTAAQRARGLDTEGSWLRRGRGLVAVAAPTVLGAVREVETRTLALETRGFTRPGVTTVLWPPHDSRAQRAARWAIAVSAVLLAVARLAGMGLPC